VILWFAATNLIHLARDPTTAVTSKTIMDHGAVTLGTSLRKTYFTSDSHNNHILHIASYFVLAIDALPTIATSHHLTVLITVISYFDRSPADLNCWWPSTTFIILHVAVAKYGISNTTEINGSYCTRACCP